MKKLEKLNLQEEEILDQAAFMAYTGYVSGDEGDYGSGNSGDISGDISGIWIPCPKDECKQNKDCGTYGVCDDEDCGLFGAWSYKKCREMNDKERACSGKKIGDRCSYINENGFQRDGNCSSSVPCLHCSTLNTWN